MDLKVHYNSVWENARPLIQDNNLALDTMLNKVPDDRFGIMLVVRLPPHVHALIQSMMSALRTVEPTQYYYPISDMHITVMSIISCQSGLQLEQLPLPRYVAMIKRAVQGIAPFHIRLKGITASDSAVLIQGFPDDNLNELRRRLRVEFNKSTVWHTIDKRYAIHLAHSTIIRFTNPLKQPRFFLEVLESYRELDLGCVTVEEIEFRYSDWYQRSVNTTLLERLRLDTLH